MLTQFLSRWAWSGALPGYSGNVTPIRLTNIVALLVVCALSVQLPLVFLWQPASLIKVGLLTICIGLLMLVPALNQHKGIGSARTLLACVCFGYVCIDCLLWQQNLNIQYFQLLGVFVMPFLFYPDEEKPLWRFSWAFLLGFLLLEHYWLLQSDHKALILSPLPSIKFANSMMLALATLACSYCIRRNINCSWQKLDQARLRSDTLLSNTLPAKVVQRLKQDSRQHADFHHQTSVLFADMQNFTQLCRQHSAQSLVALLNEIFSAFDQIAEQYQLEKIKTNGDQYIAVAGAPTYDNQHARHCCQCALNMQEAFNQLVEQKGLGMRLRIGIASGSLIAGVIGRNRFSYDVWGETVNLASRLESQGEAGKIQVSEAIFLALKDSYRFEQRGKLQVKGMGTFVTYWLIGQKHKT